MDRNRPQSRKTYVTDNSKGVHKRGSGLGTGPVGHSGGKSGGSGNRAGSSGGVTRGRSPLLTIIIAIVAVLGGGGGLLGSGALGGGSSSYGSGYSMSQSMYPGASQGSSMSG